MNESALHESAHCIVGAVLGHPPSHAVVFPGGGGICRYRKDSRCSTTAGLASIIAGEMAVNMAKGRTRLYNYMAEESDAASIRAILETLHEGIRFAVRDCAAGFAEAALRIYWPQVLQAADEMRRTGVLTGFRAEQLVRPTKLRSVPATVAGRR